MKYLIMVLFIIALSGCGNPVSVNQDECIIYNNGELINICEKYERIPVDPVKF